MALWAVICVQRVMTATPPAWMQRLLEDGPARLSGRVLVVTFVVATIALLWLSLTRLARCVAPASAARRGVQRAFRVVAISAVALYGIYATALSFNGSLDGPLAVEHPA